MGRVCRDTDRSWQGDVEAAQGCPCSGQLGRLPARQTQELCVQSTQAEVEPGVASSISPLKLPCLGWPEADEEAQQPSRREASLPVSALPSTSPRLCA